MEHKNLVIKSKSSNTAIASKPSQGGGTSANKKSWSSARFGEVNSKKRGVYVEKKSTTNSLRATPGPSDVPKAPKRSRRGEKNFLNSCLVILSQETTSTQFPEIKSAKSKKVFRKAIAETVDKGAQDLDALYSGSNSPERNRTNAGRRAARIPSTPPKQRKRFRSKALNENFNDNHLVFLQHKKRYPGSLSSKTSSAGIKPIEGRQGLGLKRSSLRTEASHENKIEDKSDGKNSERCDDNKTENQMEDNNDLNVASSVQDDVKTMATTESKRSKKVLRIEEPSTLVSDYSSKNKSLYNFFVDLLETTCDAYTVQSDYNNPSNPNFQIDDNVAKKLNINEPYPVNKNDTTETDNKKSQNVNNNQTFSNVFNTPESNDDASRRLYFVTDDGVTDKIAVYQAGPNCRNWNPPIKKLKRYKSPYVPNFTRAYRETYGNDYRSNLKSESFRFAQQLKIQQAARAESFISGRKKLSLKRNKKRSLLSILIEELQMDDECFEEPANFHQALTIMARNKRRTQKAIHRDDSSVKCSVLNKKSKAGSSDCFMRRRIISASTKSPRKNKRNYNKMSFMKSFPTNESTRGFSTNVLSEGPFRKNDAYESDESSVPSIEVNAYDYAPTQYVRRLDSNTNQFVYTSNSGVSLRSETITSSKDYLDCLEKCGKSLSPGISVTASTAISQLLLRDVYNMY